MDEKVHWTNLTLRQIVAALREDHDIRVSSGVVHKLLKKNGYRRRKAQKKTTMKDEIKHRNAQFENITQLKADYTAAGNPMVSMDTKKKENLGNFYRDGQLYTLEAIKT
ncbi:MAG: ISAzo13 family transposase, partial [bacterium]|nr:ISAzo13 family transposase [bacterium]